MTPDIGINGKHLHQSIAILSPLLADEVVLYTKTRNFHWNVSGESFMEIHKLFEGEYIQLEEIIDSVAERIGKLGGKAIGTMGEFLAIARLRESPNTYPEKKEMIKILSVDHETIIIQLRKDIEESNNKGKDSGTADFLTGLLKQHETIAWVLRRYLE